MEIGMTEDNDKNALGAEGTSMKVTESAIEQITEKLQGDYDPSTSKYALILAVLNNTLGK